MRDWGQAPISPVERMRKEYYDVSLNWGLSPIFIEEVE